jgi:hypothetical protein
MSQHSPEHTLTYLPTSLIFCGFSFDSKIFVVLHFVFIYSPIFIGVSSTPSPDTHAILTVTNCPRRRTQPTLTPINPFPRLDVQWIFKSKKKREFARKCSLVEIHKENSTSTMDHHTDHGFRRTRPKTQVNLSTASSSSGFSDPNPRLTSAI